MWWCAPTSCRERLMAARLRLQPRQESWSLFIYFLAISFSITKSQKRIAPSPAPSNQRVEGTSCPRSWRPPHSPTLSPSSCPPPRRQVGALSVRRGAAGLGPGCSSRVGRRASRLEPGSLPGLLAAAFDKAPLCVGWGPGRLEPAHIWRPAEAQAAGGRQRRHPEPHARPWVNTPAPTQRLTFRPQGCLSSRTRAHATANIPPGHRAEQAAHPKAG